MSKSGVKGVRRGAVQRFARWLIGAKDKPPKARRYGDTTTPTTSENYEGMDQNYRWFRQDEMIRRCLFVNAIFATMSGFETEVEPVDENDTGDYSKLKETIDEYNRRVNMDKSIMIAQIKRSIYGKSAFEVVYQTDSTPSWLLSLQSIKVKAEQDDTTWELKGFTYEGKKELYEPSDLLYFTNLQLENDYEGLSDIEPLRDICLARHELLKENFGEIVRTIWAPWVLYTADTTMMTDTEEDEFLTNLSELARAGKRIAVNQSVTAQVVGINVDIAGLNAMLDRFDQSIIANFGTPRFLLGKPIENRATAYAELEAYSDGVISEIQRYFKRELERQWYDPLTKKILGTTEDGELPIHVKHNWNPIRTTDIYSMADAVSKLYESGLGLIGDFREKGWELMGWNPEELEKKLDEMKEEDLMEPTDIQRQVDEMTLMRQQLQTMFDKTVAQDREAKNFRAQTERIVKKIDARIEKILEG